MTGFVYIMRPVRYAGPIKIGFSSQPMLRLVQLASWSPIPLEIVARQEADVSLERRLHARFASHHSHHEWFHPADDVMRFVVNAERGMSFEAAINLDQAEGNIKKRGTISEAEREYRRWRMRVYFASERLRFKPHSALRDVPDIIETIMVKWKGPKNIGQGILRARPTEEELAVLADFVADPERYSNSVRLTA